MTKVTNTGAKLSTRKGPVPVPSGKPFTPHLYICICPGHRKRLYLNLTKPTQLSLTPWTPGLPSSRHHPFRLGQGVSSVFSCAPLPKDERALWAFQWNAPSEPKSWMRLGSVELFTSQSRGIWVRGFGWKAGQSQMLPRSCFWERKWRR